MSQEISFQWKTKKKSSKKKKKTEEENNSFDKLLLQPTLYLSSFSGKPTQNEAFKSKITFFFPYSFLFDQWDK